MTNATKMLSSNVVVLNTVTFGNVGGWFRIVCSVALVVLLGNIVHARTCDLLPSSWTNELLSNNVLPIVTLGKMALMRVAFVVALPPVGEVALGSKKSPGMI